jgi:hypothetical protein
MLGEIYQDGGPLELIHGPKGEISAGPVPPNAAIPKDLALAAKWYRVAADQGIAIAQNHLGTLYENGEGVPQDYVEAYFWLSLGEANGSTSTTDGVDDRDLASSELTKAALLEVQERARTWFEQHSTQPQ